MLGTIPPAAVVATGSGAAAPWEDQRAASPAWWRAAPPATLGGKTPPPRATGTALAGRKGRASSSTSRRERTTERSEVVRALGNEVFALLGKTEAGQCLVAVPGTSLSTAGVFGFAPTAATPPNVDGPRLGGPGRHFAVFPASPAVEGSVFCPSPLTASFATKRVTRYD